MKYALFVLCLFAIGCTAEHSIAHDQCKRRVLFHDCLTHVTQGPQSSVSNDWSEVIDACASAADYLSRAHTHNIPRGCR